MLRHLKDMPVDKIIALMANTGDIEIAPFCKHSLALPIWT